MAILTVVCILIEISRKFGLSYTKDHYNVQKTNSLFNKNIVLSGVARLSGSYSNFMLWVCLKENIACVSFQGSLTTHPPTHVTGLFGYYTYHSETSGTHLPFLFSVSLNLTKTKKKNLSGYLICTCPFYLSTNHV